MRLPKKKTKPNQFNHYTNPAHKAGFFIATLITECIWDEWALNECVGEDGKGDEKNKPPLHNLKK